MMSSHYFVACPVMFNYVFLGVFEFPICMMCDKTARRTGEKSYHIQHSENSCHCIVIRAM